MTEYFVFRESSNKGWRIYTKHEAFGTPAIQGSYALFACRLLGISWPNWLRLCEQNGAKLYGKNMPYVHAIWREPNKDFLKIVNQRANELAKKIDLKGLKW
jgi:hypothetical protein